MIVRKWKDVEASDVKEEGAKNVWIRILIGEKENAPHFIMRHFTIEPKGNTPYHKHDWEHEVFVLSGKGVVRGENATYSIEAGNFVYVPPNEMHSFENPFDEPMTILCIIPKK
ncbi:MAG: cupin domain-containing protein [Synergistetes bacterium]|nr:cupin domain-containing protein [Synergistota bacterium]